MENGLGTRACSDDVGVGERGTRAKVDKEKGEHVLVGGHCLRPTMCPPSDNYAAVALIKNGQLRSNRRGDIGDGSLRREWCVMMCVLLICLSFQCGDRDSADLSVSSTF